MKLLKIYWIFLSLALIAGCKFEEGDAWDIGTGPGQVYCFQRIQFTGISGAWNITDFYQTNELRKLGGGVLIYFEDKQQNKDTLYYIADDEKKSLTNQSIFVYYHYNYWQINWYIDKFDIATNYDYTSWAVISEIEDPAVQELFLGMSQELSNWVNEERIFLKSEPNVIEVSNVEYPIGVLDTTKWEETYGTFTNGMEYYLYTGEIPEGLIEEPEEKPKSWFRKKLYQMFY